MESKTLAGSGRAKRFLERNVLILVLLAVSVVFMFIAPNFLTTPNLLNILRNISFQGIIAFGMTMVIISGEIDLSVGSGVAFYGCLLAVLTRAFTPGMGATAAVWVSFLLVCAVSVGIGCLVALIRNQLNVPSFIITLALMSILKGAGFLMTKGFAVTSFPPWFNFIGGGYLFGLIPFPAVVLLVVFAVIGFVMSRTSFGRSVYAIGSNAESARLSGINVFRVKTVVFASINLLTALSGVMIASQIMSGTPTVAASWEMNVISSVIIGGASLAGGVGSTKGTLIGMVFLGIILNGMTLLGVTEYWQYVVKGILILSAVIINSVQLRRK